MGPQEGISERIVDPTVDFPVAQYREEIVDVAPTPDHPENPTGGLVSPHPGPSIPPPTITKFRTCWEMVTPPHPKPSRPFPKVKTFSLDHPQYHSPSSANGGIVEGKGI